MRRSAAVANLSVPLAEIGRIIRFGIVWLTVTLVYAAVSLMAIEILHFDPVIGVVAVFAFTMNVAVTWLLSELMRMPPESRPQL
jgi:hypothetical protein